LTAAKTGGGRAGPGAAPRVGLFGNLGSGNIGNDASMEAVLGYLRADHPDAIVDAFAAGAQSVTDRYGIPASPLFWYQKYQDRVSGLPALPLKVLGKGIDVFRTAGWVRRHDAVIVPGMGVLEASLPMRPWGFPYAMLLLGASGRLFGTKVALVSVGAGVIHAPLTRWLLTGAARLASYRSYRNAGSREEMRRRGLDTSRDPVYPDLAFAIPTPPNDPGREQVVCLGVMEYHGSNDDRAHAEEIRSAYLDGMKRFVRWLADNGRTVRLMVGDTNGSDDAVVREILADLRESRPDLDPARVTAQPVISYADVMRAMLPAGSVVAIRFHNVLAALKLGKPTIAISYSPKHDALMAEMGLSGFCQPVNPFDAELLVRRFTELTSRSAELRKATTERSEANQQLLRQQFAELSAVLFPAPGPATAAVHETSSPNEINARR
jgi:polysaccharide pyruvyl transferase WcaK-like protein